MLLARFARQGNAVLTRQCRSVASSPVARGLEDFFEAPLKEGEERTAGKAWTAAQLRNKSWEDLHKLWYVLLKERNLLQTEKFRYKAQQKSFPNPSRIPKVRKSMARIKVVLSERARQEAGKKRQELLDFVNAL